MLNRAYFGEHISTLFLSLRVLMRLEATATMPQLVLDSLGTSLRLLTRDALNKLPHLLSITSRILQSETELDCALEVVDLLYWL